MTTTKFRKHPESNYHSVFTPSHKTLRYRIDEHKPFSPLKHPDLLDISINSICTGGCPECYVSATKGGINFPNVVERIKRYFGPLNEQRPYQIACGGSGEPTMHPDFCEVLKTFKYLGILPNYTTNGLFLTPNILAATLEYCGGVAVSAHRHLPWQKAVEALCHTHLLNVNIHVIVGEPGTGKLVGEYFKRFPNIKTIVVLPYQIAGRAKHIPKEVLENEWRTVAEIINAAPRGCFAYGALLAPFIKANKDLFQDVIIYEPEIFSGYLMLDEDNPKLRVSSYDLTERDKKYVMHS